MLQTFCDVEESEELDKRSILPSISFDEKFASGEDEADDMR